jgi:hypothetical protein
MVSGRAYNKARMQNDVLKGFFSDLLAEIRKTNGRHVRAEPEQDRAKYEAAKKWLMGAAGVGGISAAGLYELYRMNQAQK